MDGFGVYIFDNEDIYEGFWQGGKKNGNGTYYYVNHQRWPKSHIFVGHFTDGQMHGRIKHTYPNGESMTNYFYHGEDVTSRLEKCRDATTLANVYKGFVAIINGLAAAGRGDNVAEGAARGYDAADRQVIPRAIDLTCDQLLAEFE